MNTQRQSRAHRTPRFFAGAVACVVTGFRSALRPFTGAVACGVTGFRRTLRPLAGAVAPVASRRAFSLGEVLVALTLFALLVVAVGQSISNNMRALAEMNTGGWNSPSMRAIREHILSRTSRQQIEDGGEIELAGWPRPGDSSNTTAAQPTKVRWTAEINPTTTLDLFTLTVDLQVDNADDPIEASFIVHVYRPGWGLPEDRERAVEAKLERLEAIRTARGEKRKESK